MHRYVGVSWRLRDSARSLAPRSLCVVYGHGGDVVRRSLDAPDLRERLPELDADFVFATWRGDTGGKPQDELAAIREKGYACSMGALHPNVLAIACPIFNAAGELGGGVSMTTLDPKAPQAEATLSRAVLATARQISRKLGSAENGNRGCD